MICVVYNVCAVCNYKVISIKLILTAIYWEYCSHFYYRLSSTSLLKLFYFNHYNLWDKQIIKNALMHMYQVHDLTIYHKNTRVLLIRKNIKTLYSKSIQIIFIYPSIFVQNPKKDPKKRHGISTNITNHWKAVKDLPNRNGHDDA